MGLPNVVAIVGSRDFERLDLVNDLVYRLKEPTIVVSGGARGVDQTAANAAIQRYYNNQRIYCKIFPVMDFEWELLGKSAGHRRNFVLVTYVKMQEGHVIAFAQGSEEKTTPGTRSVIQMCAEQEVPYTVIYSDNLLDKAT